VAFIDANRGRRSAGLVWGVEPICRVLQVAPSSFYAAKKRPPSERALRDEQLRVEIRRVYDANFMAYGADKVWDQLNKDGIRVARCTVERLMRDLGLSGVTRGNRFKPTTTIGDDTAPRPLDLVERQFQAPTPNRLWVADLTYVKTHAGWVYVAFIIDVFSRYVVGWQASRSLRSDLAIDALEMAIWNRQRAGTDLSGLVHHSVATTPLNPSSTCRSVTQTAWPPTRSSPPSARRVIRSITPWPRASTVSTSGS
jgi:putative transposase